MELWRWQKRLILTKVYYRFGQNYITKWGIFYNQLGQELLQIGAALLLQIGASVITNWGSIIITNLGNIYHKSGQLLQIRPTVITNWGSYYKLGQPLFQIRAATSN